MKIKYFFALLVASLFFFGIKSAHAQDLGLPYGGLDDFIVPCTCTIGFVNWEVFAPLYISSDIPEAGALNVPITPTAFADYYLTSGMYALGDEEPIGAGCFIGVEPYCFPLPAEGLVTPFTGTSPAGFF